MTTINGLVLFNKGETLELYEKLVAFYGKDRIHRPECDRCKCVTEFFGLKISDAETPNQKAALKILPYKLDGWKYMVSFKCYKCSAALNGYVVATSMPLEFQYELDRIKTAFLTEEEKVEYRRIFLASHDKAWAKVQDAPKKTKKRYQMREDE